MEKGAAPQALPLFFVRTREDERQRYTSTIVMATVMTFCVGKQFVNGTLISYIKSGFGLTEETLQANYD